MVCITWPPLTTLASCGHTPFKPTSLTLLTSLSSLNMLWSLSLLALYTCCFLCLDALTSTSQPLCKANSFSSTQPLSLHVSLQKISANLLHLGLACIPCTSSSILHLTDDVWLLLLFTQLQAHELAFSVYIMHNIRVILWYDHHYQQDQHYHQCWSLTKSEQMEWSGESPYIQSLYIMAYCNIYIEEVIYHGLYWTPREITWLWIMSVINKLKWIFQLSLQIHIKWNIFSLSKMANNLP